MDYVAVLTHNELWRDALAAIPYERRLLLLPQCFRDAGACRATIDEFGLVCARCGACAIHELQALAEKLGYVVLVAEGTPVVMSLIAGGRIDGLIGVCCLASLEKVFPFVAAAAVPALAIPLLRDGCESTAADLDWLRDMLPLRGPLRSGSNIEAMRRRVSGYFTPEALDELMGPPGAQTERIARQWLLAGGKRWRPLLTVLACEAFADPAAPRAPDEPRALAVAVECFHKASLIHDDIEDGDATRYDRPTLHERHGVPVALNVGDLLLGEGYKLLAECSAPPDVRTEMLRAAARAHRDLCAGQGAELCWMRDPRPLTPAEVLEIYAGKTAPAFEVALLLGALQGGAGDDVRGVLHEYSRSLGAAYQIRDDLGDLRGADGRGDVLAMRPSLPLALAYQRASGDDRRALEALWRRRPGGAPTERIHEIIAESGAEKAAEDILQSYKRRALQCLAALDAAGPKALLRRVVGRIFRDFPAPDAPDSAGDDSPTPGM